MPATQPHSGVFTPPASRATANKSAVQTVSQNTLRLHITPFNNELLKVILPSSASSSATNISYHTLQAFPEKGFGYIELPVMEAQKLKKKLNGSILRGTKMRIEEAKPEKRKTSHAAESEADAIGDGEQARASKKPRRERRKDGVLSGVELPGGRRVKRGWTEPATSASKKEAREKKGMVDEEKTKQRKKGKSQPSKYSKEPELLFKAKLTPVAATAQATLQAKKGKLGSKKSKIPINEVVIHEFSSTKKHASFLKSSKISQNSKPVTEYIEGKGWVDAEGNVVEPARPTLLKAATKLHTQEIPKDNGHQSQNVKSYSKGTLESRTSTATEESEVMDMSLSSSARPSSEEEENGDVDSEASSPDPSDDEEVTTSSSTPTPSDSGDRTTSILAASEEPPKMPIASPASDGGAPLTLLEPKELHPLEKLFKRPRDPQSAHAPARLPPIKTSFSFFGNDVVQAEEADGEAGGDTSMLNPPQTPFTTRDLQWRGLRSAAPTPDTAAIGKKMRVPWRDDEDDEEDSEDEGTDDSDDSDDNKEDNELETDAATPSGRATRAKAKLKDEVKPAKEKEETEFAKWFWENRGDTNRSWKKRRRETLKVKRQRENRRIGNRIV